MTGTGGNRLTCGVLAALALMTLLRPAEAGEAPAPPLEAMGALAEAIAPCGKRGGEVTGTETAIAPLPHDLNRDGHPDFVLDLAGMTCRLEDTARPFDARGGRVVVFFLSRAENGDAVYADRLRRLLMGWEVAFDDGEVRLILDHFRTRCPKSGCRQVLVWDNEAGQLASIPPSAAE